MSNEKLLKLEEKIKFLQNQKRAILNREKSIERKARTRRLIQTGALFEKYSKTSSIEEAEKLMKEMFNGLK